MLNLLNAAFNLTGPCIFISSHLPLFDRNRNGRNELICSAEASIHLNVIQLVPVSLKWSSIFFCLIGCVYLSASVHTCVSVLVHVQVYVLWAHSLGCRVDPVSCRLPPACYHGDPIWESIIVSWQGWNPPVNVPREKEKACYCAILAIIFTFDILFLFVETNCRALDFRDIVDNLVIRKASSSICCVIT